MNKMVYWICPMIGSLCGIMVGAGILLLLEESATGKWLIGSGLVLFLTTMVIQVLRAKAILAALF